MPPLSVMIKPSSSLCNLRCSYCFYNDESINRSIKSYGFMKENTLKNIIFKTMDEASDFIYYSFQGGEPTLCGLNFFKKVVEFQKEFNEKRESTGKDKLKIFNSIQTNGILIDESWCEFFKKNEFLVGISLDGTKETHNVFRLDKDGQPTYAKVMKSINLLERFNVDFNILTVVNEKCANDIEKIYLDYKYKGFKFQQYIPCLDPIGEDFGKQKWSLNPNTYGTFLIKLFKLWFEDYKRGENPYIRQFENYISILLGNIPESCEYRGVCGLQYVVESDGSVYPCDFYVLDDFKLGNLNESSIKIIDEKRNSILFIEKSKLHSNACKNCEYFPICRGGCKRTHELNSNDELHSYFCIGHKMFFKECLKDLVSIANSILNKHSK